MANEFNFFENSPLNGFDALQTGTIFELTEISGSFKKTGYQSGEMNHDKLVNELLQAYKDERRPMKFYWGKYGARLVPVRGAIGGMPLHGVKKEVVYTNSQNDNEKDDLDSFTLLLNTKPNARLDSAPSYLVTPDINSTRATYDIYFTFVKDTYKSSWDKHVNLTSRDGEYNIVDKKSRIVGAHFQTQNYFHFYMFLHKFKINFDRMLKHEFDDVYNQLPTDLKLSGNGLTLVNNFYSQAPLRFLKSLNSLTLMLDFYRLLAYDAKELFKDNSSPMIKCLASILEKRDGIEFLYSEFKNKPKFIKYIYESLDGTATFKGVRTSSKTAFASILFVLCNYKRQGYVKERLHRNFKFKIDENHRVDSNVLFKDSKEGYFNLQQEHVAGTYIEMNIRSGSRREVKDWKNTGGKYSLHPLDLVSLVTRDEAGNEIEMVVPAIMIKDIAHAREWKEINDAIRIGVNIFLMALSIITLAAGPGALFAILSIVDLGLATGDIVIQAFEDELRKTPEGRLFLDTWEKVFAIGGIVTAVAVIPSLIRSGAKLLPKISTVSTKEQIKAMLKHSLTSLESFPKFVQEFEIVTNFKRLGKSFARNMKILGDEGVLLLQGTLEGEKRAKWFLNYKGITIAKGKISEVAKWVDDIVKKRKYIFNELDEFLEQEAKRVILDDFEVLSNKLASKYIDDAVKEAKYKGVILEFNTIDISHPRFTDSRYMGGFRLTKNKRQVQIFVRQPYRKITMFHERGHLEDFLSLGHKKYAKISKKTPWLHEKSVWKKIYKNRNKFREVELADAYAYVKRYYITRGKETLFSQTVKNISMEDLLLKHEIK